MRHRHAILALLTPLALSVAGCGDTTEAPEAENMIPEITEPDVPEGVMLSDAYVRLPAVSGRPGVAYFTVANKGDQPRNIVSVTVDNAGRSEIHQTTDNDGVMAMTPASEVAVQPGSSVTFEPGGYHVMLFDLTPAMMTRTTADLTISFDNGDKASVAAPIVKAGQDPSMAGMESMEAM